MKLLPLLIVVALCALSFRVTDLWVKTNELGTQWFNTAQAASEEDKAEEIVADENLTPEQLAEKAAAEEAEAAAAQREKDAIPALLKGLSLLEGEADFDIDFARSELEVLQNLSERRKELDQKASALERKEAILKATEQQIAKKIDELTGLRDELKDLLKEQSAEEKKRIESLVKIYEGMKPKDAARILNTLEMDILLNVMDQMSERRSAPILAEMDSERAREVTTLLAEKKQLPNLDL